MNERQRMQYLEAMGIAYYVPRWHLPDAKISHVCELPAVNSAADADDGDTARPTPSTDPYPMVPQADADITQELSRLDAIVSDLNDDKNIAPVDDKNVPHQTQDSAPPAGEEAKAEVVASPDARFSLSLWRAGPDLQIIDSRRPGDALPTQALLGNILSAASLLSLSLPKAEHLNWPMVDTHPDKSWAAAREMVCGFFEGRFSAQPVKNVLVFGKDAYRAFAANSDVTAENIYADELFQSKLLTTFDARVLILPSLADILYSPQIKSSVWGALIDFRKKSPDL